MEDEQHPHLRDTELSEPNVQRLADYGHVAIEAMSDVVVPEANDWLADMAVEPEQAEALLQTNWIAHVRIGLPDSTPWALHPKVAAHLEAGLFARGAVVAYGSDFLAMSFAIEDNEEDSYGRLDAFGSKVSKAMGLTEDNVLVKAISFVSDPSEGQPQAHGRHLTPLS